MNIITTGIVCFGTHGEKVIKKLTSDNYKIITISSVSENKKDIYRVAQNIIHDLGRCKIAFFIVDPADASCVVISKAIAKLVKLKFITIGFMNVMHTAFSAVVSIKTPYQCYSAIVGFTNAVKSCEKYSGDYMDFFKYQGVWYVGSSVMSDPKRAVREAVYLCMDRYPEFVKSRLFLACAPSYGYFYGPMVSVLSDKLGRFPNARIFEENSSEDLLTILALNERKTESS